MRSALEQNFVPSAPPELTHHRRQIDSRAFACDRDNLDARTAVAPARTGKIRAYRHDNRARRRRLRERKRSGRDSQARIDDHPDRIASARNPAGQARIVGNHSSSADDDRVALAAPSMHHRARLFGANPLRIARRRGDSSVQRHREFEQPERTPARDPGEEAFVQRGAFILAHAQGDLDSRAAQNRGAVAAHRRIAIEASDNHSRDARVGQSACARRSPPLMRARLERYVRGRAASARASLSERNRLGMRTSAVRRRAATNDLARANENASDGGIGRG